MEVWRAIPGFDGLYEVSDAGRVKSLARVVNNNGGTRRTSDFVLSSRINKKRNNYRYVTLCKEGSKSNRYVGNLVLEAFVGPRPGGMHGCHNDGDTANNRLGNLRWDTPKGNNSDKVQHGTQPHGEASNLAKLTADDVREIRRRAEKEIHRVVAADFGISRQQVDKIVNGQRWKHTI